MLKAKKYNVADSNIANLGTDLEKQVKLAAAKNEKQWENAGKVPGIQIWRIEKFQVVPWPKEQYGEFFSNDSYIVLKTNKKPNSDALYWDVHFWLGETTSQDEAGTAAYKTVELDDVLGGGPVQHREVEGHETDLFLSYFPNGVKYLEGGVESGFRHVKPEEYKPRLLHIKGGKKNVRVTQVPLDRNSLNSGDSFILDHGLTLYQFSGSKAGVFEKNKASQLARALDDERGSKVAIHVIDESSHDEDANKFWQILGGKGAIKSAEEGGKDEEVKTLKKLFRLSDASGKVTFTLEQETKLSKKKLQTNDVFIVDVGAEIFTWVGLGASKQERKLALSYAQNYLNQDKSRVHLPITRILEGAENEQFYAHFDE